LRKIGTKEISTIKVGVSEISFNKASSRKFNIAEVRLYLWILLPPCIPSFSALLEDSKMFLVRHDALPVYFFLLCSIVLKQLYSNPQPADCHIPLPLRIFVAIWQTFLAKYTRAGASFPHGGIKMSR